MASSVNMKICCHLYKSNSLVESPPGLVTYSIDGHLKCVSIIMGPMSIKYTEVRGWKIRILSLCTGERSERAIEETDSKYGKLCRSISMGIVDDRRDSEEVINDSWLALWNSLPPRSGQSFLKHMCAGSSRIFH